MRISLVLFDTELTPGHPSYNRLYALVIIAIVFHREYPLKDVYSQIQKLCPRILLYPLALMQKN